jgi:hypothetical protein
MNIRRRLERLEERLGLNQRGRELLITNVDFGGNKAGEFLPGLYPHVFGEPLTPEELADLREKYQRDKNIEQKGN